MAGIDECKYFRSERVFYAWVALHSMGAFNNPSLDDDQSIL